MSSPPDFEPQNILSVSILILMTGILFPNLWGIAKYNVTQKSNFANISFSCFWI